MARKAKAKAKGAGRGTAPAPNPKMKESHEHTENTWKISLPRTHIHTLDELVKHCEIDLAVWDVERWICNKWEVAMAQPATTVEAVGKEGNTYYAWTREESDPLVIPLFQVQAWLIRKQAKKVQKGDKLAFLKEFREILATDKGFALSEPYVVQTPWPDDTEHEEIAILPVSDLHLTETVNSDDSNGVNRYNSILAASRLWAHVQKAKSILLRHMRMYRLLKIWSPILGDIVNGTVHEEYIATNDLSDPAAVILGGRLLKMFYVELMSLGLPIEIDAVHGNHARTTPKMPTKRQAHTNLDWQLYEMLKDGLEPFGGVDMKVCTSQIGMKRLFNWNYVYEHGVDVKNGAEEAFEDRLRALFDDPTYREATNYQGASFDQAVIGNLHKPKFLERTVVNGSYIGQNELGQSWRLKPIRAQQLMWGVSKSHVRTWQYNVDLTRIKNDTIDNPFAEYAAWFMKKHGR